VRSDPRYKALLEELSPGQVMWLKTGGNSLWPIVFSGDALRIERCGEGDVRKGDIAVVEDRHGRLIAHLVVETSPVRTAASNGTPDEPSKQVLGRVTAFRRGHVVVPLPRWLAPVFGEVPGASRVLRRVPGAAFLVRLLRDR
jgi:hypothetical protein